ncbi:hypothetical protein ABH926_001820 [Catenulispora sp. GP43]|uniref:hypothetical protein n=1 Tax=Catenulispora sp. GP43 TaxID=3156263 RepID=UPI0035191779
MSAPHEDDMASQPPDGDSGWSQDDFDEVGSALRERFQQAVSGLEPGPGTLEYLRRAVPVRRRRRHAALAATAVSVFAVSAGATLAARGSFESGSSQAGGTAVGNPLSTAVNDAPGGGSGHGPATPGGPERTTDGAVGSQAPSSPASAPGSAKSPQSATAPSATVTGSPLAPLCQNSSVTALVATQNGTTAGVTYETFEGTAKAACALQGLPGLTVTGSGGTSVRIPVLAADPNAAPLLPIVPAGQALVLQPGERFEFQLAWVPWTCPTNPPPTVPPTSAPSQNGSPTTTATSAGPTPSGPSSPPSSQPTPSGPPSSSAPGSSAYSVVYSVSGSQPAQSVGFRAECGAAVYVTNYFAASGQKQVGQATSASPYTAVR